MLCLELPFESSLAPEPPVEGSPHLRYAYVVRREVMFSQVCVCSTFGGGGTPTQVWMGGVPQGTPWPCLDGGDGGYTPPPPIRQSSIASTCYAAGGMPLAFTQEDFLVLQCDFVFNSKKKTLYVIFM